MLFDAGQAQDLPARSRRPLLFTQFVAFAVGHGREL
ncbi:hypothetical protein PR003_g27786 [Phytophthora rubi]|uniref:Uncharacterized protein n=1 Tax=Phytophthora rubi TaxID=129364 RepID=A0A6A4BVP2_9STRA|nr:hypothetical protein PR001_g19321 [Phytophthora rubi]KAE9281037.1 hypothetical protein PR003_g27786 [Phytophthora rubi]